MQSNQFLGRLLIAATAIALAGSAAPAANVSDFQDFSLRSSTGGLLVPGRLYEPPAAISDPTTPRPFILFLHGSGEDGVNNTAQVNVNIDNLLAEAKRRGAFLYAPQTTSNWSSVTLTDRVMSMVDQALATENIDPNRLYVTGLSNGGGGTWNVMSRYGARFAAAIPIAGVAPATDFVAAHLVDKAIAAFHARNDGTVSVLTSRNVLNSILTAAGETLPTYPSTRDFTSDFVFSAATIDLHYVELRTGGHGIWTGVYNTPPLYDWLFSHTLAVPEPEAVALFAGGGLALAAVGHRRCRQN